MYNVMYDVSVLSGGKHKPYGGIVDWQPMIHRLPMNPLCLLGEM